ncbi:hypothetical protein R1T40_09975 [Tritonibacter scottomollicae]|uniref:Uncharacterized protein n=1 Tax=Tritonibacter scottomollicae TaxID=483013 RepID=A0ABZ0HNC8_TRISK|nr:hypothetical protein [Tritonibacter scottomollicae]WOI35027.1 hypothetical protein R1T40_09975 [Tritonibacter scottomollicae]
MSEHVVIVASDGVADLTPVAKFMAARHLRLKAEVDRIAAVKARGQVPEICGDAIPEGPARGAIRVFQPMSLFPDGKNDWVARPSGYRGRSAVQRADVFDVMTAKAVSNGKPAPFTREQVAAGRYYRDLVERHACAGVRCSSVEALRSGDGGSASFIDAVLRDREEIERIRRRIGTSTAMAVRKIRPSKRGSRVNIADRRLVDMVCLEDKPISAVLRAHGWSVQGLTSGALRQALAEALGRMGW